MIARAESYEFSGIINKAHHLIINKELPVNGPKEVKIIVLVKGESKENEKDFLRAAQAGGAFDFWNNSEEDIYDSPAKRYEFP